MIVNIRGTSGTGKSFIVRRLMERRQDWTPVFIDKRKQPIAYASSVEPKLIVLGHYESPCGGCDTIHTHDQIYDLARHYAELGYNVLFEGLLISREVARTLALSKKFPVTVLGIDLPIKECLDAINRRRQARNPELPPVNPKNTVGKHKGTRNSMVRLHLAGVDCQWGTREDTYQRALTLLGL